MSDRAGTVAWIWSAVLVIVAAGLGVGAAGQAERLVVHEWGTFTSVAGPDGQAVPWRPLSGPSDLPCFVMQMNPGNVKGIIGSLPSIRATVRMETPVIYFYAPEALHARVDVTFPQGLITEWYPRATGADGPRILPDDLQDTTGRITWSDVTITPSAPEVFKAEAPPSHYYAARATDAAPVSVGNEREKFLFYRGVASFPVPLSVRVESDRRLVIENAGVEPVPALIVFRNVGGRVSYRVLPALDGRVVVDIPAEGRDLAALRSDLERLLAGAGLFPKEARAMVETWRDSWFEQGTRVFYLVPAATVDEVLPLSIRPRPAATVRTFVGRVEVITPGLQDEVERALATNDRLALVRHGRFLEPIAMSVGARPALASRQADIQETLRLVALSAASEPACPAPAETARPSGQAR